MTGRFVFSNVFRHAVRHSCTRNSIRVPPVVSAGVNRIHITFPVTQAPKKLCSKQLHSLQMLLYFIHTSAPFTLPTNSQSEGSNFKELEFDKAVKDTLDSLAEHLENLPDCVACSDDFDVAFGDGVLTLKLGGSLGTYVINKQTPNKQIWLSSPTSGPKRYDYKDQKWIYSHDNEGIHTLLERELSQALNSTVDLKSCAFYS